MTLSGRRPFAAALRAWLAIFVAFASALPLVGTAPPIALAQSVGTADVALTGPSGAVVNRAGTTFSVDVNVTPSSSAVTPDAAAAYVTFSSTYLKVNSVTLVITGDSSTYTDPDIVNERGADYFLFAAGRLNAVWNESFTLARAEFEVLRDIPASTSPLRLELVARDSSNPNRTEVAMSGTSVLGRVASLSLTFAEPTATPSRTPTSTPSPSSTPTASRTPTPTRTPVPPSPTRTTAPSAGATTAAAPTTAPAAPTTAPVATAIPEPTETPRANQGSQGGQSGQGSQTNQGSQSPTTALPGQGSQVSAGTSTIGERGRPDFTTLSPGAIPPLPAIVAVAENPVAQPFEQFYEAHQGMRVLGNTLVPLRREGAIVVQYFEKGRIEEHPEEPNPAWRFQYGLLVDELAHLKASLPVGGDASSVTYASIFLLSQPEMRAPAPAGFTGGTQALPDGSVFIPFSAALQPGPGHLVPGNFWSYINSEDLFPGGWLHDVGLPVSPVVEAVVDKGPDKGRRILVQAFQRTILTYDPLNPADYQIERANVGTDYARAFPEKFQN